ncbi:hypothetical protein BLNAU_20533 [Blattamonas nauphoetae]|uniref:Right handed beta helix domain-containing protein n=1 Tax=Blattamonas nauphoetae TaxID=2049346 RepID=A0ABQ9WYI8_9EUKA|nr:hypothetical protein BLNAU_20533 [Blattamonas nauphoetae]
MITMSENGGMNFESTIVLADVTHHSMSDHVPPFVGLTHPQSPLVSSPAIEKGDAVTGQAECITIVGTGLSLESKHLIGGTGPLFSKQLFGSEVCQRVVGSRVETTTNHDSGTGMMTPNLGGNLMCLNTSFSSCIRQTNADNGFSFENITQTHIGRLNLEFSDVTSVSFTLCTFKDMTNSNTNGGGAAISIRESKSSLTVSSCFFLRCISTAGYAKGGAITSYSSNHNEQHVSITDSSFCECSNLYDQNSTCCGGSLVVFHAFSMVIDRCFFELSKADEDGAMRVESEIVKISHSVFVECSAYQNAGAINIESVSALSLSFSQFRECSSMYTSEARDLFFFSNTSSQITSEMIVFCDSTSGTPNVCLYRLDGNYLIPQISPTHTVKSVDVSFDGDEATVTVQTDKAIKGTLNLLLDGSNVPRLVHVVFGEPWKVSKIGTVVVSSGAKGILPYAAKYTPRRSTLAPFAPPIVSSAESSLKAWNTTEIVVSGVRLEKGSYWMVVAKEEKEWNITLTRSDFETLKGTAPLPPSTSERRLEWGTQYEVTRVMWLHVDGLTEEEVALSKIVTFITPAESIHIPPSLTDVSANIMKYKQQYAFLLLYFDREVIVVDSPGTTAETEEFVVVGDDRILTHDTTYTIKSIITTPGSESMPVLMSDPISFHIPKSSYVPTEEPENPEPQPEDPDKKAMSAEMKKLLGWLIPLIISLLVALIVIIVILVLVNRRKNRAEASLKEMEEQTEDRLDEKMEVEGLAPGNTNAEIHAEAISHSNFTPDDSLLQTEVPPQPGSKNDALGELVEVMKCSGDFAVSTTRMDTTLYSLIHTQKKELRKRMIGIQVVNGLKQVVAHRGQSDVLSTNQGFSSGRSVRVSL